MNTKIIASFLILSIILVVPQINAQTESLPEVNQKLVQVSINNNGNVSVIHQIRDSDEARQLNFIDGTVSNLEIIDSLGDSVVNFSEGTKSIIILPDQGELFVKYDLSDVLILKNDMWILDFRYIETTKFIVPEEVDMLFVNERPVFLQGKNAFVCHGCQMLLEYSINEQKEIQYVNWENQEFIVEIISHAEIEKFQFIQLEKEISFKINESDQFVTLVIPLELLWGPYAVFLNDQKIFFHEYVNNGTHVWVNMKPDTSGEISIIGTTVVPEFPIIAPLAIGFMIIMMVPLLRKFNLR